MLKDSCLHYIWERFVSVSQEEEFGDLPKEMLCSDDLLGSENLKVDSEYQVILYTDRICVGILLKPKLMVAIRCIEC